MTGGEKKEKGGERLRTVFFDGCCPFCVGWVKFLLDRDGHDRLRFAALQSEWTRAFLARKGVPHPGGDSILVWNGEQLLSRSEAVLDLAEALPGVWSLGRHLSFLPLQTRDFLYDFIATRRYQWFGSQPRCWLPRKADQAKFLDLSDPIYQEIKSENPS